MNESIIFAVVSFSQLEKSFEHYATNRKIILTITQTTNAYFLDTSTDTEYRDIKSIRFCHKDICAMPALDCVN